MSWPSAKRLCRNCGGVSSSRRDYVFGLPVRDLKQCDHCNAPLSQEDDYDGRQLPKAHTKEDSDE